MSISHPRTSPLDPPEARTGERADEAMAASLETEAAERRRSAANRQRTDADANAIEAAIVDALKLTEPDEGDELVATAEDDTRSAALPARPPPEIPVRVTRPALQSVQSSFISNYSSTRSPASRTTSQTSIISTHESVPSTSSKPNKSAPQSPYIAPHVSSSDPISPVMRRMSRTSSWAPPSRSPSVSSDSAYSHLLPHQAGPASGPFPGFYASPSYPLEAGLYPALSSSIPNPGPYGHAPSHPHAQPPSQSTSRLPQLAFIHPFAGHEQAYTTRSAPPYGHPAGWRASGVSTAQALPYAYPQPPPGSLVYDESGTPVYVFPPAYVAPSVPYYHQQGAPTATPIYAYPPPQPYAHAPVPMPTPVAPSPAFQRRFSPSSAPSSPRGSVGTPPGPYSPQQPSHGGEPVGYRYPISSNRSSVSSSHPSSRTTRSASGVYPTQTALPPPGHAPPIPPRPVTQASYSLSNAQAQPPTFSPLPTVGERDSSGGTQTSIGSPAANPPASVPGLSPTTLSGHDVSPTSAPFASSPPEHTPGPMVKRRDLPRPPTHSPHALWVGNVPSDASHAELWQFFQTRPTPHMRGVVLSPGTRPYVDLDSNGVESIHLIARSNCAFVNYSTPVHLRHAAAVANNVALRPDDPRAKKLVCRLRHQGDDARTGVGAQRLGGMHKAFVREQRARMVEAQQAIAQPGRGKHPNDGAETEAKREEDESVGPLSPGRSERELSLGSIRSGSTTSSFLAKHFERRYFILKSHNEQDLLKAVETGSWSTQAHNEPVLQQAFRTARSVYLIFGVNGSGCWFGYARMVGPISGQTLSTGSSRHSRSSLAEKSSASTDLRMSSASQTIPEEEEQQLASGITSRASSGPTLFSPSEQRYSAQSPQQWTPSPADSYAGRLASGLSVPTPVATRQPTHTTGGAGGGGGSAPPTLSAPDLTKAIPLEVQRAMSREQDLIARETADHLHLPPAAAEAARRASSLGSGMSDARAKQEALSSTGAVRAGGVDDDEGEEEEEPSPGADSSASSGLGSPRKELLAKAAEARNARLEEMAGNKESKVTSPSEIVPATRPTANRIASWGTPFAIDWIKVAPLPFARTRHIRNSFNGNREIKISRDGTEVEPTAGELLLSEWWRDSPSGSTPASGRSPTEAPQRPPSPQPVLSDVSGDGIGHIPKDGLQGGLVQLENTQSSRDPVGVERHDLETTPKGGSPYEDPAAPTTPAGKARSA